MVPKGKLFDTKSVCVDCFEIAPLGLTPYLKENELSNYILTLNPYKNGNLRFSTHMTLFDKPNTPPGSEFQPESNEIGPEA